jgi:hypothetical protein
MVGKGEPFRDVEGGLQLLRDRRQPRLHLSMALALARKGRWRPRRHFSSILQDWKQAKG